MSSCSPGTSSNSRASTSAAAWRRACRLSAPTAPQVEQVLLNLILNASDAMSQGGILRLSASQATDDEGHPCVALEIRDNGAGMSPDQIANLFAPFLTYKESGTGIGLAIVKKIMEGHQSKVVVESKLGQGTKFTLLFRSFKKSVILSLSKDQLPREKR